MSTSNEYVIISGVRTPFGRFGGSLKDVNVIDLGAEVMKEAIKRAGLKPEQIDEVWWGCGDTSNTDDVFTPVVGRQSLLEAGLPPKLLAAHLIRLAFPVHLQFFLQSEP